MVLIDQTPPLSASLTFTSRGECRLAGVGGWRRGGGVGDTGCAAEEGGMCENVIHRQIRDQWTSFDFP